MAKAKAKRSQKRKSPTKGKATTPVRKRPRKAKAKAAETGTARAGKPARAAPPKGGAQDKKKKRPPVVKPAGAGRRTGKAKKPAAEKASQKRRAPVKPIKAQRVKPPRKPKRLTPAQRREHERELARRRKRDRARRVEQKKAAELGKRRRRYKRQRRERSKFPAGPGVAWLRRILTHCREVFECDMETTFPGGGIAAGVGDVEIREQVGRTPWLVVGKYIPEEPIGYAELADAFMRIGDDLLLEADIGPQRFTQIRVLFHDPKAKMGEGDAVISKVGSWEFVWSDLIGELVGSGDADSPDEDSLAARYQQTSVPIFYVFLSESEIRYRTAFGRGKTQELKL